MSTENSSPVMHYYAALEGASYEMLEAARSADWDGVCRLEGACAVVIAKLRQMAHGQPLTGEESKEKMRILSAILDNDAKIRRICEPLPALLDPASFSIGEVSLALH